MSVIEFGVNSRLELIEWNEELARWAMKEHADLSRHPYHQVLPPLRSQDKDLVAGVVSGGKPVTIPSYPLCGAEGASVASVSIEPRDQGAWVRLEITKECRWATPKTVSAPPALLAHGVRNPLNAIKGAATYLKARYAKETELIEFTGIMEGEIARLENFITAYLSNSFAGCQKEVTNLNQLLQSLQTAAQKQAHTWEVGIDFLYGAELQVVVNAFQIEQAILHLVNYAVDMVPPGGKIHIETGNQEEGAQALVIIRAKEGPNTLGSTGAVSAKDKGSGLFLAREILQSHGGKLEIHSTPLAGTSIQLSLPAAR